MSRMKPAAVLAVVSVITLGLSACGATVEQKAATGAVAGAVVGGPVGAAVGGAAGTAVGQAQIVAQTPSLNDFAAANLDFGAGFGFVRPASGRACVFSPPDFRRPLWAAP